MFIPEVSPSGRYVAFAQGPSAVQLLLLDLDRGTVRQVTHGRRRHITPTSSPDGRYLAYVDAPLRQAKLIKDEQPTSIVRIDVEHLDRRPHVLVTGKTEVFPITWQPAPGDGSSTAAPSRTLAADGP